MISTRKLGSVISNQRNWSFGSNLAINDLIPVESVPSARHLFSLSCQKFFQLRIIIFPGMSRWYPSPVPTIHTLRKPSLPRQSSPTTAYLREILFAVSSREYNRCCPFHLQIRWRRRILILPPPSRQKVSDDFLSHGFLRPPLHQRLSVGKENTLRSSVFCWLKQHRDF